MAGELYLFKNEVRKWSSKVFRRVETKVRCLMNELRGRNERGEDGFKKGRENEEVKGELPNMTIGKQIKKITVLRLKKCDCVCHVNFALISLH